MADVIKTRGTLQMVAEFADGDDRTLSVDNPRADVSASDINAVSTFAKNNSILLGDKEGANFTRIKTAKKVAQTTRYLDLSNNS